MLDLSIHHRRINYFKVFLCIYIIVLVFHALALPRTLPILLEILSGLTLAIFAHLRKSYLTIILLVIHMTIEWIEYASKGASYSIKEIIFYGIHTLLDIVFLWQEVRTHIYKYRFGIVGGILLGLAALFICIYQPAAKIPYRSSNPIEAVVIGGIFGCACSHLLKKTS